MFKEFHIKLPQSDNYSVPTIHCKGASPSKKLIIMCHGITTDKNEYLNFFAKISHKLSEKGIDSARFDFRGHGDSNSKGDDFTIISQVNDLQTVINHFKDDYTDISLLGCSFGAPPCLMIGKFDLIDIRNIFLVAPVLDYERTFFKPETPWGKEYFGIMRIKEAFNGGAIVLSERIALKKHHFIEMRLISIESNFFKSTSCNIHIMHGDKDDMVAHNISREWSEKYNNITLHSFKNMEHGFTDKGDETGDSNKTNENLTKMVSIISEQ